MKTYSISRVVLGGVSVKYRSHRSPESKKTEKKSQSEEDAMKYLIQDIALYLAKPSALLAAHTLLFTVH